MTTQPYPSIGHELDVLAATHRYFNQTPKEPTMFTLADLSPQAKIVVRHIAKAGSITQREALADHSVQSLTRRITEIRNACIPVTKEAKRHPVTGQRYMRYGMVQHYRALVPMTDSRDPCLGTPSP